MRKPAFAAIMLIFVFVGMHSVAFATEPQPIRFIYFNDFHSQNTSIKQEEAATFSPMVGGAATLTAYIDSLRRGYEDRVCVVDAGDDFQGSPICELTRGLSQVLILNAIQPDVMALGNHDFDYGREGIRTLFDRGNFPIVASNIIDKITPDKFAPRYIIKKIGSVRVGFVGLISNSMPKLTFPENIEGYVFLDTQLAARSVIDKIKKKVDLIVVVSHCGDRADISLARKVPGIDIIFGAHTHKTFYRPLVKNDVIICQAGAKGKYVGVLDVWFNGEEKAIAQYQSRLVDTFVDNIAPNPHVANLVDSLENGIALQFDEVIATLKTPWKRGQREECNIGNWITDAMRDFAKTDVAIQNKNGIRKNLSAGDMTVRDVWEIIPFPNRLATFQLSGAELRKLLEHNLKGKSDFLLMSGIRYNWYTRGKAGDRLRDVRIAGKPMQDDAIFSICTNDYLVSQNKFSDAFGISRANKNIVYSEKIIRDILIESARQEKDIVSNLDGRITLLRR